MKEVNVTEREEEIAVTLCGEIDSGNADAFFGEVKSAFERSDVYRQHYVGCVCKNNEDGFGGRKEGALVRVATQNTQAVFHLRIG